MLQRMAHAATAGAAAVDVPRALTPVDCAGTAPPPRMLLAVGTAEECVDVWDLGARCLVRWLPCLVLAERSRCVCSQMVDWLQRDLGARAQAGYSNSASFSSIAHLCALRAHRLTDRCTIRRAAPACGAHDWKNQKHKRTNNQDFSFHT